MKLVNETNFAAGWTVGFQPDGREVAVVAVRATYLMGERDEIALADSQESPREADVFGEDPANDAPVFENDFALFKPRCDVLLRGSAYAPSGVPATRVDVGVMLGELRKMFSVVGPRVWVADRSGFTVTSALPFTHEPISYDVAFGGTDRDPDDPERLSTFVENPAGLGYCAFSANLDGMPLPRTHEIGVPVVDPAARYRPMALGPVARNWFPRFKYAGTYDDHWAAEKLPFLPDDFDYQYFQAAPLEQQIPYPRGGEMLALKNLTPGGHFQASIPHDGVVVAFVRRRGSWIGVRANCDTVLIEPDEGRLSLVWRATCALERDPFELREMVVQHAQTFSEPRMRARVKGIPYYEGLDQLVRSRRGRQ